MTKIADVFKPKDNNPIGMHEIFKYRDTVYASVIDQIGLHALPATGTAKLYCLAIKPALPPNCPPCSPHYMGALFRRIGFKRIGNKGNSTIWFNPYHNPDMI